jgi:Ni,Fe-hydrogenase maturation factor
VKQLWIAVGNPLRGDDGAAHVAVDATARGPHVVTRHQIQLTPELAPLMAEAETVVIVDAALIGRPAAPSAAGLTHHLDPETLVRIAWRHYGFRGQAYVCSLAAESFDGGGLSATARVAAGSAAALLSALADHGGAKAIA